MEREHTSISREFHIFAGLSGTQFVVKSMRDGYPRTFPTLFEAARHARTQPDCEGGSIVIYDEEGRLLNRIPISTKIS